MGNVVATIINWPKLPKRSGKTFHERKADRMLDDGWIDCRGLEKCPIPLARAGEYEIRYEGPRTTNTWRITPETWCKRLDAVELHGWGRTIVAYKLKNGIKHG